MERADRGMPFILRYENVAWYEDGRVRILDRRIFPIRTEYVECTCYAQVVAAIRNMVTQSGGPYIAASMGMVLAVYEGIDKGEDLLPFLERAQRELAHARPTTAVRMEPITQTVLQAVRTALEAGAAGGELVDTALTAALEQTNRIYRRNRKFGAYITDILPHGATVLTHCYGESVISGMLVACKERGNPIRLICDETRPYFQGSRLTASVAADMGFETVVISDGMPAYIMETERVDALVTGSDLVTMDGHVVNKVGTFSCALAAKYWGIPFYPAGNPNLQAKDRSSIHIEERDAKRVLEYLGIRLTLPQVTARYPAFDITPPGYCTGIITDRGIFAPTELSRYFARDFS